MKALRFPLRWFDSCFSFSFYAKYGLHSALIYTLCVVCVCVCACVLCVLYNQSACAPDSTRLHSHATSSPRNIVGSSSHFFAVLLLYSSHLITNGIGTKQIFFRKCVTHPVKRKRQEKIKHNVDRYNSNLIFTYSRIGSRWDTKRIEMAHFTWQLYLHCWKSSYLLLSLLRLWYLTPFYLSQFKVVMEAGE